MENEAQVIVINVLREVKEARIRELVSSLSAPSSAIGDWKVIKCYEAKLLGEELPYDLPELMAERQKARDEINRLQEEIEAMEM